MQIGRRIYYEKLTGNVILDTGERSGNVVRTTVEQDFASYADLAARVPASVDYLELQYGQFGDDFRQCNGVRVDLGSGGLVFSYPDPNEPGEQPVYQAPLTEQVSELKLQLATMQAALDSLILGGGV